ncbi:MAG: hypothetical protein H6R00_188 [Proteobacteria bacterium]|nr:hypothetical protein [Pseudomonadota bacterium]
MADDDAPRERLGEAIAEAVAAAFTPEAGDDASPPPSPEAGSLPVPVEDSGEPVVDWDMVKICSAEPETDIGNGRRFLIWNGDRVVSIEGLGWAVHDGKRWGLDYFESAVRPLAHHTVEAIRHEARFIEPTKEEADAMALAEEHHLRWRELVKKGKSRDMKDEVELFEMGNTMTAGERAADAVDDRKSKRARYAKTSASSGKMDNMMNEAKCYRSRPVSVLDSDPYAINFANGTVRLYRKEDKTWTWRIDEHNRADLISKLAPVEFLPEAECPVFLTFIETVLPDDDVRAFMKRYLGYCLTALTHEQVFTFLYGMGRNGKSTLVDIICRILGDYTTTVPFETLAGDDRRKGSEATPDLVRVPGARIVRASEPESGMKFRESMVKSLTSGEPILIRRMREEFIEIYPTFKLIVSGNHRPDIRGGDDGIWRRVLLVPFEVQIPKDQVDRQLPEKLWAERSGILNWLLQGALSYLEEGLKVPDAVRSATEDYREQSDPYGAFLKGACLVSGQDDDIATPGELYAAFKRFCERQGFFCVSVSTFNKAIPEKAAAFGFRKAKTNGLSVYRGIRVLDEFKFDPSYTPAPDGFG